MSWTWPCTLYQAVARRTGRAWLFLNTLPSAYDLDSAGDDRRPLHREPCDTWWLELCLTSCLEEQPRHDRVPGVVRVKVGKVSR